MSVHKRNQVKSFATALLSIVAAAPLAAAPSVDMVRQGVVLDGVTVIDTRTGAARPNSAVWIQGERIVKVAPAHSFKVARTARRVSLPGRFVVPGYNDMHAHNLNSASPATSLPLMLASGITGFRQMAGSPELLAARASGKPILPPESPALLAMPGAILIPGASATAEWMRAEVRRQKQQGADFIKIADAGREAYLAAIDEARLNGLPIAGHLVPSVTIREAAGHGMTSVEHLGPGISVLLSCSRDEDALRRILSSAPEPAEAPANAAPEEWKRLLANPMAQLPPPAIRLIARTVATFDEAKCRTLARDLAAGTMWQVPTLARLEAMEIGDGPSLRDNPDNKYVPAESRALWNSVGDAFSRRMAAGDRETLRNLFELQLKVTKLFDEAGVKMLAGTDFGGGWLPPASLHHEFDLLARAGIPPLRILQMTTIDAARFLGRERTMGAVEPGMAADLVVLDANPLAAAGNLHGIAAVMRAGRLYMRAELDTLKRRSTPR
ncbi:amidohydrolase family protein [Sphingobium fuliginis ATCC 27551]|uniref:Amidohydrolase family protein n=1 Tax=Sphingobium fuliginis ATCC 27551 TaxID=1208342 RepID=A0A5B8CLE6_SPHSA|nr:amidohydrolase family protein [Sphingobium fuliginis ATCC 27551]